MCERLPLKGIAQSYLVHIVFKIPPFDIREFKIDVYDRQLAANDKLQIAFEGKFYKISKVSTSF
jgi:hypothetical protein